MMEYEPTPWLENVASFIEAVQKPQISDLEILQAFLDLECHGETDRLIAVLNEHRPMIVAMMADMEIPSKVAAVLYDKHLVAEEYLDCSGCDEI